MDSVVRFAPVGMTEVKIFQLVLAFIVSLLKKCKAFKVRLGVQCRRVHLCTRGTL